jgi:hypothetical protein
MNEIELKKEIERIRRLSPQDFVSEQKVGTNTKFAFSEEGLERNPGEAIKYWNLGIASATDKQIYELAKVNFFENPEKFKMIHLAHYVYEMFCLREQLLSHLNVEVEKYATPPITDMQKWAKETKSKYEIHRESAERAMKLAKDIEGTDFGYRA